MLKPIPTPSSFAAALLTSLLLLAAGRAAAQPPAYSLSASRLALATAPSTSFEISRDTPPSSGIPQLAVGWALSGIGVLNLALIPVCFAEFYPDNGRDVCKVASIAIGVVGLAVGIPLLISGYNQRARRQEWQRKHGAIGVLQHLQLAPQRGGWLLAYRDTL